jgi:hypothetical protein
VSLEHGVLPCAPRLPDERVARPVARGEKLPIRGKLHRRDPVGVPPHLGHDGAVLRREEPNDLLRPAEGDGLLIGRDVRGEHLVELVADLGEPPGRGDVPDHDPSALGGNAASGENQFRVAGEAECLDVPLREGKHAQETERRTIQEQHLPAASDGENRSVGRGGEPGDRHRADRLARNLE